MLQPKKSAAKTAKEKKNIKDATQMKNMRPTGPTSGRIKPSQGSAKNGKPVKKAFLGSLLGGAGGAAGGGGGKGMLGGMGKQMLGGLASKALGGLMGGGAGGGGRAAAQGGGGRGATPQAAMPRKSTDTTPVRTRGMKKGGKVSKAKNGKSFPDLNKDGKITKADILKGRGVIAKKGMSVKKAQDGDYLDSTELIPRAGAMLKTKVKERSPDGNYIKKTVTKTKKGATNGAINLNMV